MISRIELEQRAIGVVSAALDHGRDRISPSSSLIDDLGAESIDFLDIIFRLETEFEIKIPNEEVWAGAFQRSGMDDAAIQEGVKKLRERMPEFRWDRLPSTIRPADLPRLITVTTIVDYLDGRLNKGPLPA
jgi:acyl carrier protein